MSENTYTTAVTFTIKSDTAPSRVLEFLNFVSNTTNKDENAIITTMASYVDAVRKDMQTDEPKGGETNDTE